ncbi:MAG: macrocin-O-methyltransferase [Pedosphaera sp.]|nr:macrocin-O-methyltransferase [Pedosphaera sp.]
MKNILRDFTTHWRALANTGPMMRLPKTMLRSVGFDLVRLSGNGDAIGNPVEDLSSGDQAILWKVKPFTLTGVERIAALLEAVGYVTDRKIPGDIAECGVWRGGSMMAVALALMARGDVSRSLYLYDTFEGMSAPTADDTLADGRTAAELLKLDAPGTGVWCNASLEDVRKNMLLTGYPLDKIHFIKGKVEETIPGTLPGHLALLRLDTDWYESTKHELQHLFPLLDARGVLILDDYGTWQGARKAVDEYLSEKKRSDYLHRIDATGRMLVRTGS